MHDVPAVRKLFMSVLAAAALLAGALSMTAPTASAALSDCPRNAVCIWSGTLGGGQMSWFGEGDTGCHPHPNNTPIWSAYNRTRWDVRLGDKGFVHEGQYVPETAGGVYGEICFGV